MTRLLFALSPTENRAQMFCCDATFGGQFAKQDTTSGITASHICDHGVREPALRVALAVRVSSLLNHIVMVVLVCAKKQVARIDAFGVITMMANAHITCYGTVHQFVSNAVRLTALVASQLDLSIAFAIKRASPLPATRAQSKTNGAVLIDFFPKSLSQRAMRRWLMTANIFTLPTWKLWWRNFLTTATFTQNEGRDMITHVNSPFTTLTTPQDGSTHRCGNFVRLLLDYFSTNERDLQSVGGAV